MIRVNNTITLRDAEIQERFVRSQGARGQNARKEETGVELRFDIAASSLPPEVQLRLMALGGRHVTQEGVLVTGSRANRSQAANREAARTRLLALLQRAAIEPTPRIPTRLSARSGKDRLEAKRARTLVKRLRSRSLE